MGNLLKLKLSLTLGLTVLLVTGASAMNLNESGTMTLQGRVTTQGTMRTVDTKGTNLEYNAGDLVSQKNTLMLEYRWNLNEILPGITSTIFMQPRAYYDGAWDYGARSMTNSGVRNKAGYYNQGDIDDFKLRGDIFTGYIDFTGYGSFMRVGKQAFSWGEMSTVRILDGVNPLNTQGPGIAMEERLIPLGLVRANYTKVGAGPFSSISLEGYWVPKFEHTVNEESPLGGPISTTPDLVMPQISRLDLNEEQFDKDRYGVKLGFAISKLNLNFAYYRTASDAPASVVESLMASNYLMRPSYLPKYYPAALPYYNKDFFAGSAIKISYQPVDVIGGSFNYSLDAVDAVLRGEMAYKQHVPFTAWNKTINGGTPYPYTSDVLAAGIGIDKNFDWKWLNPENQIRVSFEQVHSKLTSLSPNGVYGWSDPRLDGTPGQLNGLLPLYAAGSDYTGPTSWETRERLPMNETSTQSILIVGSDFMNAQIKPNITTIFEWETSAVMLIPSVTFTKNTNWDVKAQYTHTFSDTYKSLGMTRDRNEFALTFNYFF